MRDAALVTLFASAVSLMVPLLLASLGEIVTERAGVLNIGVEGCMVLGAFAAAAGITALGGVVAGLLFGLAAGVLAGVILAVLYIGLKLNQIIAGLMFTIAALGITATLFEKYDQSAPGGLFSPVEIPLLSDIPFLGEVLFSQSLLVYGAFLVVPLCAWLLSDTWFGLATTAAGENPAALDAAGYRVNLYRAAAVVVGSTLAGLGGAALVLATSGRFVVDMTAGRGFIALGVVIVARWNPWLALLVCFGIGVTQSIQFNIEALGVLNDVPTDIWVALPYLAAIFAVVVGRRARYPAAITVPWRGRAT